MSRRMVAPGVWAPEEPSKARLHVDAFVVSADAIGSMKPILSANYPDAKKESDYRKTQLAEASARYRARKAA